MKQFFFNKGITTLVFLILFTLVSCHAQTDWRDNLTKSKYHVGFKTVQLKDYSRLYKATDAEDYEPRPVQLGIWYPSHETSNSPISLKYYTYLENTEENLEPLNAKNKVVPDKYSWVSPELLNTKMMAELDLAQASWKFPLIIYGSAQDSSGYGNAVLCELLASHGYIAVTVASKNLINRQMPLNTEGIEAQTRDLEFVFGHMYNHEGIDLDHIGAFGFSFGGMNIIPFSLKNRTIKALVALDGSLSAGYQYLEQFPNLDLNNLNSNFLGFLGDKDNIDTHKLNNEAALSEIYVMEVKDLVHYDFSSSNLMMGKMPKYKYDFYADMANMTLKFFDMNLKGNDQFKDAFDNSSKSIYSRVKKIIPKNQPKVLKEDFIDYANKEGIDKATEVYYLTKSEFPDYKLFDYDPFRDVGFLFFITEDYTNAIKAYEVLLDAYPDEDDSYRRLGETYMLLGKYKEARILLEKGLKINPASPALKEILRILTEKDGG